MKIALIAAMDKNRVIGFNNQLPWHLPADLAHFKKITLGKPIVMGRKTFESIGKPLPGRRNIVITRDPTFYADNIEITHSLDDAFLIANHAEEIMIIGGAAIFEFSLAKANRLYLTYIDAEFPGDTFFPTINPEEWREISREDHLADETNPYDYHFVCLQRK